MTDAEIEQRVTDPAREDFSLSIIGLSAWTNDCERTEFVSWQRFVIPRRALLQSIQNTILHGVMVL
jgi:hypothetical protein